MLADINTKVVLVQRQTLDWGRLDREHFRDLSKSFCQLWGKADDFVYRLMLLWDETFSITYFETRQRVKEIAQANIRALEGIEYIPYEDYRNIPDGSALYLFIDDDDWLAPNTVACLTSPELSQYDGVLWRIASIGSPNQPEAVFVWGLNGRCMTNNYAINGRWLDGLRRLPEVIQHAPAVKTFAGLSRKTQLDSVLSVTNKNPCSSVFLDNGLQGEFYPVKLCTLVASYVDKMKRIKPKQLAQISWAAPYIEETIGLFERVLTSHKSVTRNLRINLGLEKSD